MLESNPDSPTVQIPHVVRPADRQPKEITFFAPGFKKYHTSEYADQDRNEFVSISVTGMNCALNCEHCRTNSLKGMVDLPSREGKLYELCAELKSKGTKGILLSGGSDRNGRVPLLRFLPELKRVKNDLGLRVSVHPGLPDGETCAGLAAAEVDAVMLDIIGDDRTIKEIYHLDKTTDDYSNALRDLSTAGVPMIPHVMVGHYYGKIRGEYNALEMIRGHRVIMLVIIVAMPLEGTGFTNEMIPAIDEIRQFFGHARAAMRDTRIVLGCARPMGNLKTEIDRAAIDAGFDGIAFPMDGIVNYSVSKDLKPIFRNSCCGVSRSGLEI